MFNLRFFFFLFFSSLQIAGFGQTANCSDSSYRKYFYIPNDSIESIGKIDQPGGSQLILGRHKSANESYETGLMISLDPLSNKQWSKDFVVFSHTEQFRLIRGIRLSSGEYVCLGRITSPVNPLYNKSVILKTDQNGTLIWSRILNLNPLIDASPLIQLQALCEGLNGDILVSGTVYTNLNAQFAGQAGLVIKISAAGDPIFSRMHLLDPGTVNDLIGVFVNNGQILLFGEAEDGACLADARGGIYSMVLDYTTGNEIKNNRYCLGTPDGLNSYASYLHNYEVRQTNNGYAVYGFLAESGSGARDFLVESFNPQGERLGGLTITDHLIGKAYHNITVDDNGGIYLMGVSQLKGLFGSVFKKNGELVSQIKLDFPNFDNLYFVHEGGQKLSASAVGFANYINNSTVDNHSAITLINKFSGSNFKSACLGVDTSFSTIVANNPATPSPFVVKQTIYDAVLFSDPVITTRDNLLITQDQCSQASHCTTLSIQAMDTICGNTDVLELTALKSATCFQHLNWTVDSSWIGLLEILSDSSVSVHLKKGASGLKKLETNLSISGCGSLQASHITTILSGTNKLISSVVCEGDSIKLSPGTDYSTYHWINGSSDSIFFAKESGQYIVETRNANCVLSDTFQVPSFRKIQLVDLGPNQTICEKDQLIIHAGSTFISYRWQNGSTDSLFRVEQTGDYSVSVKDACGVTSMDTVKIKISPCTNFFRMPTGFTPNDDHINDLIKPVIQGKLESYYFQVFNRWGQRVFSSKDFRIGWDGKINNTLQSAGVFVWSCEYKFHDETENLSSGTFLLIR